MFGLSKLSKGFNKLRKGGLSIVRGAIKSIDLKKLAATTLKGVIASNPYLSGVAVGWKMLQSIEKSNPKQMFTIKETKAFAAAEFQKGRIYERNLINNQRKG